MRKIYLPIAAALAIGLGSGAATVANADSAAGPEDKSIEYYRAYGDHYGGHVYVAPTYAYREHYYGYPPAYAFDDRYHRHYHRRPLFGLHLPFVGLHLG
jgi:hypothetical protein